MLKFRIGDKIRVLSGKDKGREGKIEKIYPKKSTAVVPGINMYKKHIKKDAAADGKGGVYDVPRAIRLSKISHIDPKTGKNTRVSFKEVKGKKIRIATKSGVELSKKLLKKTK